MATETFSTKSVYESLAHTRCGDGWPRRSGASRRITVRNPCSPAVRLIRQRAEASGMNGYPRSPGTPAYQAALQSAFIVIRMSSYYPHLINNTAGIYDTNPSTFFFVQYS